MGKCDSYWLVFNDWWRSQLDKDGKRPNAKLIKRWYKENAVKTWDGHADGPPTYAKAKSHADGLRSVDGVRSYFQSYRAAKKPGNEGAVAEGETQEEGEAAPSATAEPPREKGRCLPLETKVKMSKMKIWSMAQGPPPPGHEQAAAKRKLEEQEMMQSRKIRRRGWGCGEGGQQTLTPDVLACLEALDPEALLAALQEAILLKSFNNGEGAIETMGEAEGGQTGEKPLAPHPQIPSDSAPSNAVSCEAPTQSMPTVGSGEGSGSVRGFDPRSLVRPLLPPFPLCPLSSPIVGGKVEGLESLFASPLPPPPFLPSHLGPYPAPTQSHLPPSYLPPSTLKQQHQHLPHDPPSLRWSPADPIAYPQLPMPAPINTVIARPPPSASASATRGGHLAYPPHLPKSTSSPALIPCPPGSCTKKYLSRMSMTSSHHSGPHHPGAGGAVGQPLALPSPLGIDQGLQLDDELLRMLEGTPTRHQMMAPPPAFTFQPASARTPVPPLFHTSSQPFANTGANQKLTTPLDRQALASLFGSSPL